jgi:hypothetical protein
MKCFLSLLVFVATVHGQFERDLCSMEYMACGAKHHVFAFGKDSQYANKILRYCFVGKS